MLLLAGAAALFAMNQAAAQEVAVVDVVEDAVVADLNPTCGTRYYSTWRDNWFLDLGAGINMPFVEAPSGANRQITANYGVGFGKWFSPYFAWRLQLNGGSIHWIPTNNHGMAHAKTANANVDVMWDLFNSLGGVNTKRVFSIVPFVGIGGTFNWDYKNATVAGTPTQEGHYKRNEWLLPVSAGLQFRFRLCDNVNFFLQARASFYGDSYNNDVVNKPVDINLSALGGFTIKFGGDSFKSFDPCEYTDYINNLNGQVNALRAELAGTTAALSAALAQLPCPEVKEAVVVVENAAPLLSTVRFNIDSARILPMEQINVYNVAEWMKANEDQNVVITGYADKDTGTTAYNMQLSEKRADAVYNMLVNEYGINPDRLTKAAKGSDVQLYDVNNWNRIVVFSVAE